MGYLVFCQTLSAVILILLVATLVIKEHENRKISFFVPSVILALLSTALSIYDHAILAAALQKGTDIEVAEAEPVLSLLAHLLEAFSLSFFACFSKLLFSSGHAGPAAS